MKDLLDILLDKTVNEKKDGHIFFQKEAEIKEGKKEYEIVEKDGRYYVRNSKGEIVSEAYETVEEALKKLNRIREFRGIVLSRKNEKEEDDAIKDFGRDDAIDVDEEEVDDEIEVEKAEGEDEEAKEEKEEEGDKDKFKEKGEETTGDKLYIGSDENLERFYYLYITKEKDEDTGEEKTVYLIKDDEEEEIGNSKELGIDSFSDFIKHILEVMDIFYIAPSFMIEFAERVKEENAESEEEAELADMEREEEKEEAGHTERPRPRMSRSGEEGEREIFTPAEKEPSGKDEEPSKEEGGEEEKKEEKPKKEEEEKSKKEPKKESKERKVNESEGNKYAMIYIFPLVKRGDDEENVIEDIKREYPEANDVVIVDKEGDEYIVDVDVVKPLKSDNIVDAKREVQDILDNIEETVEVFSVVDENGDVVFTEEDINESVKNEGTTVVEPETKPDVKTTPDEDTPVRKSPLAPKPGIKTKPKAELKIAGSKEAENFLARRLGSVEEKLLKEGIEIHPDKSEWIKQGDEVINALMPKLSEEEKSYLEMVTSDHYKNVLEKLERYTGIKPEEGCFGEFYSMAIDTLRNTMAIEYNHVEELEKLAVDLVLGLPEFELVKEAVENGDVEIDAYLDTPTPKDYEKAMQCKSNVEAGSGLTQEEEINKEIYNAVKDLDDAKIKRRFANLMTQGSSINKLYLFHLAEEELRKINDKLPTYYGILGVIAELGYWVMPSGIEKRTAESGGGAGVSMVEPKGDDYKITAVGMVFPYLVHEIVKGVYEWFSLAKEFEDVIDMEDIEDETRDIIAGPGIYKKIIGMIPTDKQKYLPMIIKKLLEGDVEDIKAIIGGDQSKMDAIISEVEKSLQEV